MLSAYLEGHWDLEARLLMAITRVTIMVIRVMNRITKSSK